MAGQGLGKARQPFHGQVPLAQFEVTHLLAGRSNSLRQGHEREALRLAQLFQPVGNLRFQQDLCRQIGDESLKAMKAAEH